MEDTAAVGAEVGAADTAVAGEDHGAVAGVAAMADPGAVAGEADGAATDMADMEAMAGANWTITDKQMEMDKQMDKQMQMINL